MEVGRGAAVLELGCGKGDRLAALAALGVRPVGVDISAVQVAAAATRWGSTVEVHQADALHFLSHTSDYYDAVYSAFGAHWFTDPDVLLPAIRERLRPGGTLVLAHLPPGDRIEPDEPTVVRSTLAMVLRWEGEAHQWASLLRHHGFVAPSACAILPPHGARTERTVVLRSRVPARPPRTAQGTTTPAT
ncbi:class I SAM-dependent methyltransferase [Streptomyces sp. PCS3-D2]|uniref:class I SAM-dependent methyltransferase n=1 Tax=Streptomyces sp. PCS3-D2 TaxID=1460244 RepID=UPI0006892095|nr:class I SAM-dependent methyltransferase [Streptomyces sp. PCS3-D2]WKV71258.1 class I SAM-dependent methyltransferase [Streptomyces sp. PCS3-D2]